MPSHQKAMRTLRELYGQAGRYDELEKLYGQQGQWDELYEVLLGLAERADKSETRIDLYLRAARVGRLELSSPERAQKAYERILLVDPQHLAAAQALVPIYQHSEKWPRLLSMYEILLSHASQDDERLSLMARIAELAEAKLSSKQLAFQWSSRAYALREREAIDAPARVALEKSCCAWPVRPTPGPIWFAIYARQLPTLEDAVAPAVNPHKIARLRSLAQWSQQKLGKLDDARGYWEQVLARIALDDEALSALEQIFQLQDRHNDLIGIYRKRPESAADSLRASMCCSRWRALRRTSSTIATPPPPTIAASSPSLRRVSSMGTTMRALRALEKIYTQSGDSESLAEVLERQLQQLESTQQAGERNERSERDAETLIMISFQLGELYARIPWRSRKKPWSAIAKCCSWRRPIDPRWLPWSASSTTARARCASKSPAC